MLQSRHTQTEYQAFHAKGTPDGTKQDKRPLVLLAVFILLPAVLLYRLWNLQVINGQDYADAYELKITKTVRDKNTRGMIYDCNGEVLASNQLVYTVTMTDEGTYASSRERHLSLNGVIYRTVKMLMEHGEQIQHGLSIKTAQDGSFRYTVSGTALVRFKADIFGEADPDDMTPQQRNMTAGELIQFLLSKEKFALFEEGKSAYSDKERKEHGLPADYSNEELLAVAGIRYQLSFHTYRKYIPVTLAWDVSEKTAAYVFENRLSLPGIAVGEDWNRVYEGGEALSHILGYTGKISETELEQMESSGGDYTADSVVGKAGIEQYFEKQLQGVDGERQITVNNTGKMTGEAEVIREAQSGRDVYLSIDKNLQTAVYSILEQNLAGILAANLIAAKTFDKTQIADASQIRIPIYDVYLALAENNIISLEKLYRRNASKLEQQMARLLNEQQEKAWKAVRAELLEGSTSYENLTEEMQEYLSYLADETGILDEAAINKTGMDDEVYQKWKKKAGISAREFFAYAAENGWIADSFLAQEEQEYFTSEEMYELVAETAADRLADDDGFRKLLFRRLVLADKITGREICMLLFEQKVLKNTQGELEKLQSGALDAFSFLKNKIGHLEITPAQLALDPCSASAVVVHPGTGKVLALVSYPGYDNGRLANQMDTEYYSQLLQDKSLPLYNRATQQLTAPGSTLKPVTIIAGLQEGVLSTDSPVFCDGVFDKVEPHLKCWKHAGHGEVAGASAALQFSCNDYLCETAYRLGSRHGMEYTDRVSLKYLQKYARLFHLDKKSGIEITESEPHVTDAYGIPSAIGQGTHNYAAVQLARYAGTLASGGDIFSLSLVRGIAGKNGVLKEKEPVLEGKIQLPDAVWNAVHQGMLQFARNNALLKDMELPVAGKTGTAQESRTRPDHALFIGYAPAEQPEIALAVRIANGYGSSNATAAGKSILNFYFGLESRENILTGEASQAFNASTD